MTAKNNTANLSVQSFEPGLADEIIAVVNAYVADWPYTRPIDEALIKNWQTKENFQPANVLLARRDGKAVAFLHGELRDEGARIHLLAVPPGEVLAAAWLLEQFEAKVREAKLAKISGPHWWSQTFYASYLIGHECGHPHWAVRANEAFARGDFVVKGADTFMVRDLSEPIELAPPPEGYEIREMKGYGNEFGAEAFSHRAFFNGEEIAHCYCRLFPHIPAPDGKPVGQFGHVGTDEAHRGKGIARRMVNAGLAKLRDMGASEALIVTQQSNVPAMRSYRRSGYQQHHVLLSWQKELA
jgi:GNAT superfamily N-acetyltransferase